MIYVTGAGLVGGLLLELEPELPGGLLLELELSFFFFFCQIHPKTDGTFSMTCSSHFQVLGRTFICGVIIFNFIPKPLADCINILFFLCVCSYASFTNSMNMSYRF